MTEPDWLIRLRLAHKTSKVSQREVARRTGLSSSTLSDLFSGKKTPGVDNLLAVCRAVNASPYYILTGTKITVEDERVLLALSKLSPKELKAVHALIDDQQDDKSP